MKADVLFLERGCSHCGAIRAVLNMDAVAGDEFRGLAKQHFFVFVSQSNEASKHMLNQFGVKGHAIPCLLLHTGDVLEKKKDIIAHLKENFMAES